MRQLSSRRPFDRIVVQPSLTDTTCFVAPVVAGVRHVHAPVPVVAGNRQVMHTTPDGPPVNTGTLPRCGAGPVVTPLVEGHSQQGLADPSFGGLAPDFLVFVFVFLP